MAKFPTGIVDALVHASHSVSAVAVKGASNFTDFEAHGLLHLSDAASHESLHRGINVTEPEADDCHEIQNRQSSILVKQHVDFGQLGACEGRLVGAGNYGGTFLGSEIDFSTRNVQASGDCNESLPFSSELLIGPRPLPEADDNSALPGLDLNVGLATADARHEFSEQHVDTASQNCGRKLGGMECINTSDEANTDDEPNECEDYPRAAQQSLALASPVAGLAVNGGSQQHRARIGKLYQVTELPAVLLKPTRARLSSETVFWKSGQTGMCQESFGWSKEQEVADLERELEQTNALPVVFIPRPKVGLWKPLEEGREFVTALDLDNDHDESGSGRGLTAEAINVNQIESNQNVVGAEEMCAMGSCSPEPEEGSPCTSRPSEAGEDADIENEQRMSEGLEETANGEGGGLSDSGQGNSWAIAAKGSEDEAMEKIDTVVKPKEVFAGSADASKVRGRSKGKLKRAFGKGCKGATAVAEEYPFSSDLMKWRLSEDRAIAPGIQKATWTAEEMAAFVLALYLFGKQFRAICKFVQSKIIGDMIHFYYGDFYATPARARWLAGKPNRSTARKYVRGSALLCGWRQKELLRRLAAKLPTHQLPSLTQVSAAYNSGEIDFEAFILSLRDLVGTRTLTEGIGVGSGKGDLTSASGDPGRGTNPSVASAEIPTGVALRALSVSEVVAVLVGGSRLSKARAQDLFWEAVWPRLEANGWNREGPAVGRGEKEGKQENWERWDRASYRGAGGLFFAPGVRQVRGAEKGSDFFDSLSMVLEFVAKNPACLEGMDNVANKQLNESAERRERSNKAGGCMTKESERGNLLGRKRTGSGKRDRTEAKFFRKDKATCKSGGEESAGEARDMETILLGNGPVMVANEVQDLADEQKEGQVVIKQKDEVFSDSLLSFSAKQGTVPYRVKNIHRQPTLRDWQGDPGKPTFDEGHPVLGRHTSAPCAESGSETSHHELTGRTAIMTFDAQREGPVAEDDIERNERPVNQDGCLPIAVCIAPPSKEEGAAGHPFALVGGIHGGTYALLPVGEQASLDANLEGKVSKETAKGHGEGGVFQGQERTHPMIRKRKKATHILTEFGSSKFVKRTGSSRCESGSTEDGGAENSGMEDAERLLDREHGIEGAKKRMARRRSPLGDEAADRENSQRDLAKSCVPESNRSRVEHRNSTVSTDTGVLKIAVVKPVLDSKEMSAKSGLDAGNDLAWMEKRSKRSRNRRRTLHSRSAGALRLSRPAESHSLTYDLRRTGERESSQSRWKEENEGQGFTESLNPEGILPEGLDSQFGKEPAEGNVLRKPKVSVEEALGKGYIDRPSTIEGVQPAKEKNSCHAGVTGENPTHFTSHQNLNVDQVPSCAVTDRAEKRRMLQKSPFMRRSGCTEGERTEGGIMQVFDRIWASRELRNGVNYDSNECMIESGIQSGFEPAIGGVDFSLKELLNEVSVGKDADREGQKGHSPPLPCGISTGDGSIQEKEDKTSVACAALDMLPAKQAIEGTSRGGGWKRKGLNANSCVIGSSQGEGIKDKNLGCMAVTGRGTTATSLEESGRSRNRRSSDNLGVCSHVQNVKVNEIVGRSPASSGQERQAWNDIEWMVELQAPRRRTLSPSLPRKDHVLVREKDREAENKDGPMRKAGACVHLMKRPERPAEAFEALILVSMEAGKAASITDFVCKQQKWTEELAIGDGPLRKQDVDMWMQSKRIRGAGEQLKEGKEIERTSEEQRSEEEDKVLKWGGKGEGKGRVGKRFRAGKGRQGGQFNEHRLQVGPFGAKDRERQAMEDSGKFIKERQQEAEDDDNARVVTKNGQVAVQKLVRAVKQIAATKAAKLGDKGSRTKVGGRPFTKWLNGKLVRVSARGFTWGGRRVKGSGQVAKEETKESHKETVKEPKKVEGAETGGFQVMGPKKRGRPKGSFSKKGRKIDVGQEAIDRDKGSGGLTKGSLLERSRKPREGVGAPVEMRVDYVTRKSRKRYRGREPVEEIDVLELSEVVATAVSPPRRRPRCPEKVESAQRVGWKRPLLEMEDLDHGLSWSTQLEQQKCELHVHPFEGVRCRSPQVDIGAVGGIEPVLENRRKAAARRVWQRSEMGWTKAVSLLAERRGDGPDGIRNPERKLKPGKQKR